MNEAEQHLGKAKVTGDIGDRLSADLTAAKDEQSRKEGAGAALRAMSKKMETLFVHLAKDVEEKKIGKRLTQAEALELTRRYIRHAASMVANFAALQDSEKCVAGGKVAAIDNALKLVTNHHAASVARLRQIEAVLTEAQAPKEASKSTRSGREPLASRRAKQVPKKTATKKRMKKKAVRS